MVNAKRINERDNVAVVIQPVPQGGEICLSAGDGSLLRFAAAQDIGIFHKVATRDIPKGSRALKYGEPIGVALQDIAQGEHVHIHNIASEGEEK